MSQNDPKGGPPERIEAVVGPGVVTELIVLGPVAPSWVKGRRRVPGPGPRDTYG